MSDDEKKQTPSLSEKGEQAKRERAERAMKALRENLLKRKAQARLRAEKEEEKGS